MCGKCRCVLKLIITCGVSKCGQTLQRMATTCVTVCNSDIPVCGLFSAQGFYRKTFIDLLTIPLFRDNNFTSCNKIYFEKFWSARVQDCMQLNILYNITFRVTGYIGCIPPILYFIVRRSKPQTSVHFEPLQRRT